MRVTKAHLLGCGLLSTAAAAVACLTVLGTSQRALPELAVASSSRAPLGRRQHVPASTQHIIQTAVAVHGLRGLLRQSATAASIEKARQRRSARGRLSGPASAAEAAPPAVEPAPPVARGETLAPSPPVPDFDALDLNNDGVLKGGEIFLQMRVIDHDASQDRAWSYLELADTDGDEGVSPEELSAMPTADDAGAALVPFSLEQMFAAIDTDDNGEVDATELQEGSKEGANLPAAIFAHVMRLNGHGTTAPAGATRYSMTAEEYAAMMRTLESDSNHNAGISPQVFRWLDLDEDGVLTGGELDALTETMGLSGQLLSSLCDMDGSGDVSAAEFERALSGRRPRLLQGPTRMQLFHAFDADWDGYVSRAEFEAMVRGSVDHILSNHAIPISGDEDELLARIFDHADVDDDGRLNRDEIGLAMAI